MFYHCLSFSFLSLYLSLKIALPVAALIHLQLATRNTKSQTLFLRQSLKAASVNVDNRLEHIKPLNEAPKAACCWWCRRRHRFCRRTKSSRFKTSNYGFRPSGNNILPGNNSRYCMCSQVSSPFPPSAFFYNVVNQVSRLCQRPDPIRCCRLRVSKQTCRLQTGGYGVVCKYKITRKNAIIHAEIERQVNRADTKKHTHKMISSTTAGTNP